MLRHRLASISGDIGLDQRLNLLMVTALLKHLRGREMFRIKVLFCIAFCCLSAVASFADTMTQTSGRSFPQVRVDSITLQPGALPLFEVQQAEPNGQLSTPHPVRGMVISRLSFHSSQSPTNPPIGRPVNVRMRDGKVFSNAEIIEFQQQNNSAQFFLRPPNAAPGSEPFAVSHDLIAAISFIDSAPIRRPEPQDTYSQPTTVDAGPEITYEDFGDDEYYYSDEELDAEIEAKLNSPLARGMMLIIYAGLFVLLIGQIWMTVIIYQEAGCLGVILAGFPYIGAIFAIYYLIQYWSEMKVPFLMNVCTILVMILAVVVMVL